MDVLILAPKDIYGGGICANTKTLSESRSIPIIITIRKKLNCDINVSLKVNGSLIESA